jgi:hypothetical protein
MASVISIVIWSFREVRPDPRAKFSEIVAYTIEAIFGVLFLFIGSLVCFDLCHDQTQLQRWDAPGQAPASCRKGYQEVFGRGSACLWCVPTAAFGEDPFE